MPISRISRLTIYTLSKQKDVDIKFVDTTISATPVADTCIKLSTQLDAHSVLIAWAMLQQMKDLPRVGPT